MPSSLWFQSTRPRGTRLAGARRVQLVTHVSIHASTRNATPIGRCSIAAIFGFQSTRPRGTRPFFACSYPRLAGVSIHASTRNATNENHPCTPHIRVSIHASTRNATSFLCDHCIFFFGFNPRVHEERDSIRFVICSDMSRFNPRVHEERDHICRCRP